MKLARELSQAVLLARTRIGEALARAEFELSSQHQELRHLQAMPSDPAWLENRIGELEASNDALRTERDQLTARRDQLLPEHRAKLTEACQQLAAALRKTEARSWHQQVNHEYRQAIGSFERDLRRAGMDEPKSATPAQLKSLFVNERFREMAGFSRTLMIRLLEQAKSKLIENASLSLARNDLAERRNEIERELQTKLDRLQPHQLSVQSPLIADILEAEPGVLRQLRRDVLEPLLAEAQSERQSGLGVEDPLNELRTLRVS